MAILFRFSGSYTPPPGGSIFLGFLPSASTQQVAPPGIDAGFSGATKVTPAIIFTSGLDGAKSGLPSVRRSVVEQALAFAFSRQFFPPLYYNLHFHFTLPGVSTQVLNPYPIALADVGTAKIGYSPYVLPVGVEAIQWGVPLVTNKSDLLQAVEPGGFVATGYGNANAGRALRFKFDNPAYVVPPGSAVAFDFVLQGGTQGIYAGLGDQSAFGVALLGSSVQSVKVGGIDSQAIGAASVRYTNVLRAQGFVATGFGWPMLQSLRKYVFPVGFTASLYGTARIWNLRQHVSAAGFRSDLHGKPNVLGGVKYAAPAGIESLAFGQTLVINTTADQTARPPGIEPPLVPKPFVSPQTVFAAGLYSFTGGIALVQRNPSPLGWDGLLWGRPVVYQKTRYVRPAGIDGFETGYPRAADKARKLLHKASAVTTVFGDTRLRLKNYRIQPVGFDAAEPSHWAEVRNTRRPLLLPGFVATAFGGSAINNKTPALWPAGIMSQRIGAHGVGYSVRHVFPAGAIPPYPHTGHHSLWQTPSLGPASIPAPLVQPPTIWHGIRAVEPVGWLSQQIGEAWPAFRWRRVVAEGYGIDGHKAGEARLEHADRRIPPLGRDFLLFGSGWVSHGRRVVDLAGQGVEFPGMSNHRVGYTRQVAPFGFEATRWLTTIVPEAQDIYPKSFGALYGWPKVEHYKRYLRLTGITTYPEPQMHWGTARVWNLRQIITQVEDQQSGLWPPAGTQWTMVENRNRLMRSSGWAATRYGNTHVELGARVILPAGIPAPTLPEWQKVGMVSHRVRKLPLDGLEPPYVGHWGVVWNKADPLHPRGFVATLFGQVALANTRRYRRIEGFTPDAYGYPLVAYRIRELTFEPRYGIHPPVIALPRVFHYTRYVEPPGIGEPKASVLHILESRFNRIVTRWSQQGDLFGWPALKNLTPELGTRGRAADEWGDAFVRLEWRPVAPEGTNMQLFGGLTIADRTRRIVVAGASHMTMGQLTAKRIGTDPVVTQYIDLRLFVTNPITGEQIEFEEGYGIKVPEVQVPRPDLTKGYLFPRSDGVYGDMAAFGKTTITANTIRVEPGYWDLLVGEPYVGLKVRALEVKTIGQLVVDSAIDRGAGMGGWGMPRLSPHTIYAVLEAPAQAMRNHKMNPDRLRPVNAGVRIGHPSVTQYLGLIFPSGIDPDSGVGRPEIISMRRAVAPHSFNALRVGWPVVPGIQHVTIEEPILAQPMPSPAVAFPPQPPVARPEGIAAPPFGRAMVDFYHRSVAARGWLSLLMDGRSGGDGYNMPQRLHIGPPNLHQQIGFDAACYGSAWVSHRVREVAAHGHDSFVCDYELEQFAKRMRVRNADARWPGRQIVAPAGHRSSAFGHAAARPARHYIRPDGNSNQHRKGAPAI